MFWLVPFWVTWRIAERTCILAVLLLHGVCASLFEPLCDLNNACCLGWVKLCIGSLVLSIAACSDVEVFKVCFHQWSDGANHRTWSIDWPSWWCSPNLPSSPTFLVYSSSCGSRCGSVWDCTQTWLILPAVICLSQRLSHACLSVSFYMAGL